VVVGVIEIVGCIFLRFDLHQDLIQVIAIDIAAFYGIRIFRFRQDPPSVVIVAGGDASGDTLNPPSKGFVRIDRLGASACRTS